MLNVWSSRLYGGVKTVARCDEKRRLEYYGALLRC